MALNPALYTFYPGINDGQGNVVALFDFTEELTANEPLSCSMQGLVDGSGEITGTVGTLIEHPADIIHYLFLNHTDLALDQIDVGSIRTMRSLLPGLKFAVLINQLADGDGIIDRILSQCQCSRIHRGGKAGIMTFDIEAVQIERYKRFDLIGRTVKISKSPEDLLCNNLEVFYNLNPVSGQWEGSFTKDKSNNRDCELSYFQYGKWPQKELYLTDVQVLASAALCADRFLKMRAFRHDLLEISVPYWEGIDVLEGDGGLLTVEEGSSFDGEGWVNESFILLERKLQFNTIWQKWWRIGIN